MQVEQVEVEVELLVPGSEQEVAVAVLHKDAQCL
jgi:hypothetical protein